MEVFGIQLPASLITLQLLAVFVSVCFIQSLRGLGSYVVLLGITNKLLEFLPVGAEFVVAKYDASHLWANVLKRRQIGYVSPLYHIVASALFSLAGLLLLFLHWIIVGAAFWTALAAAFQAGADSFAFFISLAASISFIASIILFLLGFVIPVPYPASKEMQEAWGVQRGTETIESSLAPHPPE